MTGRPPSYRGCRFPPEIISHVAWLYHRFGLSVRDIENLLAERGVTVTYEAIRQWCRTFGLDYARRLRRRRGRMGDTWHLDEVFIKLQGRPRYLWRAVDEDGDTTDILAQSRRDRRAALLFFRKLLKGKDCIPRRLITDKLRSYPAACRTVMPSVVHCTDPYANNRANVSHQPTRQPERQMRRFKSAAHAQRFLAVHGFVPNLFRVGRHPPAGHPSSALANTGLRCLARDDVCLKRKNGSPPHRRRSLPVHANLTMPYSGIRANVHTDPPVGTFPAA